MLPPVLALSASLLFSAFLLWKGREKFSGVSWATWIPTLWMMRCASRSLTLWLYPRGGLDAEALSYRGMHDQGSLHDQVFFVTLMVFAMVVLVRRVDGWGGLIGSNGILVLFFAYMLISVFWSPEPSISLKRWFRTFGDLLAVLVALSEPRRTEAVSAILWRCAVILIPLSVVLSKYYRAYGRMQSKNWLPDTWIGVTTHKNSLAALALLAALFCVWRILISGSFRAAWRDKRLELLMCGVSVGILLGAGGGRSISATSVLVFFLGVALMLWMRRSVAPRRGALVLLFVVLMVIALANTLTGTILSSPVLSWTADVAGRDSTLTGRTQLWIALVELGSDHALYGAGFDAFWDSGPGRALADRPEFTWRPRQAHNGYLDVYLHLGIVGLFLFTMVCWRGFGGIVEMVTGDRDRDYGQLVLVLFIAVILHNLTESSFVRPAQLMWFTFLLTIATVPATRRQVSRRFAAYIGCRNEIQHSLPGR